MDRNRSFLARAASVAALAGLCGIARAGSLEPPPGPVAPTMKTLSEVEARTPIHQSDLPLTITADGSYYLAENLSANQNGADMITVLANYVSIDLNGFTVNGTGQSAVASECIQIESDVRTFTLTNGTIRGCGGYGVYSNFPFALTVTVDGVHANQNGQGGMIFTSGTYGVITRSVARSNGTTGIFLSEGVLSDCAAYSNVATGLQLGRGTINGSTARLNGLNGIIMSGGAIVDSYFP